MKRLKSSATAVAAIIIGCSSVGAQKGEERTGTRVTEATVFIQGAELVHTAEARFTKGTNEVTLEGLSPNLDRNSIKVNIGGSVVVSAFEYSIDFLNASAKPSVSLGQLRDSLELCRERLDRIDIQLRINSGMLGYLETGVAKNVSGSEAGLGIDELRNTMEYFQSKSGEILFLDNDLRKERAALEDEIRRLTTQYEQEAVKNNKTSGLLKLNVSAPVAGTFPVTVTYYTAAASWEPYYDIIVTSIGSPVSIAFKSKLSQSTGLDWDNVRLTLSTAVPTYGKAAPLFSTWYLMQQQRTTDTRVSQNSYSYEPASPVMESVDEIQGQLAGIVSTRTAISPIPVYVVDGIVVSEDEFNSIDPALFKDISVLKEPAAASVYGARGSNGVVVVTLKSSMDDFITEEANALNVVYNIEIPYSIPGNGKAQNIDLVVKETFADYKYYCAPRLDPATYLLAEIPRWQELGLMSGYANITYDGTYMGEVFIDAESTAELLSLTLGVDKRVAVKRELVSRLSTVKTMGNDIQKVYTYELTVKNNQVVPIRMVLKDQYPQSTQKNVSAQLNVKDTTPWTVRMENTGVITWEEEFAPGETRTYQIGYTVKYPRTMYLNL